MATDIRYTCTTVEALEWVESHLMVDTPADDARALFRCRAAFEAIIQANEENPAVLGIFDEEGRIPTVYDEGEDFDI